MSENKPGVPKALYIVVASVITLATLSQWVMLKYGRIDNDTRFMDDGINATVLYESAPITSFHLSNHKGEDFNQTSLTGKWSFLTFGYTHCPDICPTTLHTLNRVEEILRATNSSILPQTLFITLDPERDDVATLAEYIPWFNANFIGLTGNPEQIDAFTKSLGIMKQKREDPAEADYVLDHTVTIMLVDNKGQLRALTSPPHDAQSIANDFVAITRKFN